MKIPKDEQELVRWVRAKYDRCEQLNQPWDERINSDLAFALSLKHFATDDNETLDSRRLRYKGRELFSKLRRSSADAALAIADALQRLTAIPVEDGDATAAEGAAWAAKFDLNKPENGFQVLMERAMLGARAARLWCIGFDWDATEDDVLFRTVDPTRLRLCPPFQDTWDRRLPWLYEVCDEPLSSLKAKKGWKNLGSLVSDQQYAFEQGKGGSTTIDEHGAVTFGDAVDEDGEGVGGTVKYVKFFVRRDGTTKTEKEEKLTMLENGQMYHACPACGYQTPPAPDIEEVGEFCPVCAEGGVQSLMMRVAAETQEVEKLAYPNGRVIVVAVNQGLLLWNGTWEEWAGPMRGYPYMQIKAFEHPRHRIPLSDTATDRSQQLVSNVLMLRMYRQAMSAPNVIGVAGGPNSIKNAQGGPFTFTDEPWQVAFFDDALSMSQAVQHFNADPITQGLVAAYDRTQNSFRADMGTAELGLTQENSKDIPVGTVRALVQSGVIPTDHFVRRVLFELGIFCGPLSDVQRFRWTRGRWVRMANKKGEEFHAYLKASDIPSADFRFSADQKAREVKVDEFQRIMEWSAIPSPALRRIAAPRLGLAQEDVLEIEKEKAEFEQLQAEIERLSGENQQLQQALQPPDPFGGRLGGMMNGGMGGAPSPSAAPFGAQ